MDVIINELKGLRRRKDQRQQTEVSIRAPFARLRSQRGESLVESIVAFAVITVILIAFAAFANLGSNLTAETSQLDQDTNSPISQTAGTATVQIESSGSVGGSGTVTLYKNDAGVYRYSAGSNEPTTSSPSDGVSSGSSDESSSSSSTRDNASSSTSTGSTSASSTGPTNGKD